MKRLAHGLSYQEAVEGVGVVHRESGDGLGVSKEHRKVLQVSVLNELRELFQIGFQFSQANL